MKLKLSIFPLLLMLSACASLGLVTPQSFDERLSYAYDQHTAALQSITTGVTFKDLTGKDGMTVLAIADNARLLLDSARIATQSGDVTTAEGRLVLATNVLRELNDYLRDRGVK
mgnify:CR=1 FL=1